VVLGLRSAVQSRVLAINEILNLIFLVIFKYKKNGSCSIYDTCGCTCVRALDVLEMVPLGRL
jgi:hypothetical protein